jgi:1-acyl-sn-glycerol-3-phosphate acyltransferase
MGNEIALPGVSEAMDSNTYALPGNRISVANRRDWLRSMVGGAYLFGPAHRRLMRAAHSEDRQNLHQAEKRWARTTAMTLGLTFETSGLHHIDPTCSYVVLPLHEGFADLLAIQRLPLPMVYAAAEELFEWEHLGPYLRASAQPSISRTNGPQAYRTLLRTGRAASARGESLVVFPQGTLLGIEMAFTGGAFRAAQHLDMPILPVVLTGASKVWDYPFSPRLHFGRSMRMEVLAPVPANLGVATAATLEAEMKSRALNASPGPRRYFPERDGWWDDYRFEIDPQFPEVAMAVAEHRATRMTMT